ncbi:MAG: sugar transferase [Synechococcales bacterium]|nr:sugar transferase [Synechococcales bacterium]
MSDVLNQAGECVVAVDHFNQTAIIHLPARLTVLEAIAFKETFQQLCTNHPNLERADLDFRATWFIDSSGIGALVNAWKTAQAHHIELKLCQVTAPIWMTLNLAGLDTVFTIVRAEEKGWAAGGANLPTGDTPRLEPPRTRPLPTHPSVNSVPKRLMDILGALVGLGITAIAFIPIAIAIKRYDGGPIFFGQTRCSLMGRHFRMWKFRSMVVNAESLKHQVANQVNGPLFKNDCDPRVTPIGCFLRRSSLDELPQFWNVLKGDMSLVGTRPPTPDELERYEIPQWQRLDVKPGITGEWQVNGRSSIKNFEDVIRLDLRYQERWSLWYDMRLILKTIQVLLSRHTGAV